MLIEVEIIRTNRKSSVEKHNNDNNNKRITTEVQDIV